MFFDPTFESVNSHRVPEWFQNAKLGIFIHWGLYSVPAWAPLGGDIVQQVDANGWASMFANNPYAEWYLNSYRLGDTPVRRHHLTTYGPTISYDDFATMFEQGLAAWQPDEWASLFRQAGARYAILTTKHHDGFLLWPSAYTSPLKPGRYGTKRDLVGELTNAVRRQNMRMGLYYSGGLDWSFNETPIRDISDLGTTIVQSSDFVEYVTAHYHELIERYSPSVLWNDIGYPRHANVPELFAYYYNTVPDGIINDRWSQENPGLSNSSRGDYTTPEYATYEETVPQKWEATRGIGHSFGYNQNEGPDQYLSIEKLVRMFVDIVSKNGNLLLNVGPMADGTIPPLQRERLLGLGAWLDMNGEAIFGTTPWIKAESKANGTIDVRFTQTEEAVYATLLDTPSDRQITIEGLQANGPTIVSLLGQQGTLTVESGTGQFTINLPEQLSPSSAYVFKITPKPHFN